MSNNHHVIVGWGITGLSVARFLEKKHITFSVIDSRTSPPDAEKLTTEFSQVKTAFGGWDEQLLATAGIIILSPGVSIHEPVIQRQIARGCKVIGDIELFCQHVNAPIIAITGTNAKSTVTTLVANMAENAGLSVKAGGNLGIPALDLLIEPAPDVYVLELSSFQLDTTYSLQAAIATVLNLSPDHLDRYASEQEYYLSKLRIYEHCQVAVSNKDDPRTYCANSAVKNTLKFTLNTPGKSEFGLIDKDGQSYLSYEEKLLLPVADLPIRGKHYVQNALAALAIGYGFGLDFPPLLHTLREFKGLAHRCQLVRTRGEVSWFNDSKGTNVGATLAAINGLGSSLQGKIILIAGGVGKGADFSALLPALKKYVRETILIGETAPKLAELFHDKVNYCFANSMEEAVNLAAQKAVVEDCVLLSPACASFDMFKNYQHRGDVFIDCVQKLP